MLVLQNEHRVGIFAVVVNEIKRDCCFAVFVRVSVFVLLHHGGGEGLRSWFDRFTINISPLAEMVICMAVASRYVFLIGYCLYVSERLGDYLLIYCTEIYLCSIGINDIEPNAVIGIYELINCFVVLIFPGSKYSVLNQSANVLIAFVICKSREFADVANAVVCECNRVA